MLRVVTLGLLVCAVVFVAFVVFSGNGGHRYTLDFQNAAGIVSGNLVMVGGHPVGSVDSVELSDDNRARMEVELDDPIREGTTAIIRRSSLSSVHNHYISLTPGPDNAAVLEEGTVLGEGDTTTAVELDQIFDMFDAPTRKGWSGWIRGVASIYKGRGATAANRAFKYTGASFSSTQRLMAELGDQSTHLDRFVKNTSGLMTRLASKEATLTEMVSNANAALGAIARQNESLSVALQELPPTLRQANTTFVNLRAALDDVQPMVGAAGRAADAGLARFLREDLRPVLTKARPVFSDLADVAHLPGPDNDMNDLLTVIRPIHRVGQPAVNALVRGMDASQEDLATTRAYSPDLFSSFARLGAVTGNYDAHGHYARVRPTSTGLFNLNGNNIEPATTANYGGMDFVDKPQRCPGGAARPIAGSNPFLDNGKLTGKCDPAQVP